MLLKYVYHNWKDYDENLHFRYLEEQDGQIIPMDVLFFTNKQVRMQPTCATTKDAVRI